MTDFYILLLLLCSLQLGCSRNDDLKDIQREDSYEQDDLRESDNFKRSVPVDSDKPHLENGFQTHD